MKTLANVETNKSVSDFIATTKGRQAESRKLFEIMQQTTGKEPKM